MTYLDDILDNFIKNLNSFDEFSNIKIIKSFPYGIKPTELSKTVISIGLNNVQIENASLGETSRHGKYSVCAKIFSPYKLGGAMPNLVFQSLSKVLLSSTDVVSLKSEEIYADESTSSFVLKCSFNFEDELYFGGVDDE